MIPATFTERFLWAPQPPATAGELNTSATAPLKDGKHEGTLPIFRFTGGVQSTLNSLVALAFSEAEKRRSATDSVSDIPPEKCLVLSSPTKEGTHIVDAAVRHAANKQGAYVLVLDALELAAGKLGSLGKDGQVLDELYAFSSDSDDEEGKSDNDESPRSQRTRALIDALLCLPTPSTENPDQESQLPPRRIVYLRDFQYIDKAAKPLLTHILRSLHESRTGTSSRPATILAFGSTNDSESLEIGNTPTAGEDNCLFLNSLFTHARARVANTPARKPANSKSKSRKGLGGADSPPSPGFASFLMNMANSIREPKSGDDLEPIPFNSAWGKKVNELATQKLSISVFAENVKSGARDEEWQKASKAKKIERLNQLLLRACLEKKGCLLEGDWDEVSFDSVLEGQSDTLLEVADANSIVTITKGLVADASSPAASSDSESTDTPKLVGLVSEAYKTFKRQQKERSEWENGKSSNGKPKDTYDDVKGIARVLLSCLVDADAISTTFSDVFVDGAIVDSLKTIVTLPLLYPQYFNDGVLSKEAIGGILLYGPPGTGKTMLCRALAKSTGTKMLHIKPSDINDKCVGESEKRIAAVFKLAHRLAPCIIFIDEIDSLFSSRNEHTRTWERNILTEFMQGMDGLKSAKENRDNKVIVVGATNRPYDLDLAILRRMPRRILVDMPNLATRKSILESYFKNEKLDDDINLDQLASQTDGFSGSDLKNLCVAAAMNSVKEAIGPDWRIHGPKPSAETATSTTESQSGGHSSKLRKITQAHIAQARNEIPRSSVLNKWEDELYKWHEKYSTESKFGKYGSTASATGKGYGGMGSTGRGADFYSPKYSAGGNTTMAGGMGTNGMMSKGHGSDFYSSKYSAGGNTVTGAGSGNNGMMSKTGLGSDFYSSKYSTDGDNTTATGSGINGMMSKGGYGGDLLSSKYSNGDTTTGTVGGINGLMSKGGYGSDLLSSKYSADGDTTTGAGNGINGLMGKGGFGSDLYSSKYSADGDTTTGAGNGINGLMGKGGVVNDLFSSKYSTDGDATMGNGMSGMMPRAGLGSDFYSPTGLAGMNGHWNRWAKGGVEENGPRIQTLDE